MSIENFKSFVRTKPKLLDFINNKTMTWQDFYNMYELYGENSEIWQKYLTQETPKKAINFKDIISSFQNMNMNDIQKGINSLQKGINYVKELVDNKSTTTPKTNYEPRQIYKYFDD